MSVFTAGLDVNWILSTLLVVTLQYSNLVKNRFLSFAFSKKIHIKSLTMLRYNAKVAIDKELLQIAGISLYSDLNLKESHLSR